MEKKLEDYQQRVVEEKTDLDGKARRLELFIASDAFDAVNVDERLRLRRQLVYMEKYSKVLAGRINAF